MGAPTDIRRVVAAALLAAPLWHTGALADDRTEPLSPSAPGALLPITSARTVLPAPVEMTPEGKEVISKLRAGLLIDSGTLSISDRTNAPQPASGITAIKPVQIQAAPVAMTAPVAITPDGGDVIAHLRANQMIDSGAVSVSELRPGNVDQGQLEAYTATALQDRLRAGQALDADTLQISALRPGSVDQEQLQVYISMAEEPAATQLSEVDQTLVFLAAMSVADGSDPVTMETASAILIQNAGVMPRAIMGYDGVWEFPRLPTKDEREMLVGEGSDWRVVENMESQLLFLGPDRRFGWDDFADIVNPLQHIPLINVAYRAMTGDEIHGAAQLVDLALGPLAGASTVFNLAMKETTGATMEDYAMAALFGPPEYYDSTSVGVFATAEYQQDYPYVGVFAQVPPEQGEQIAVLVRRGSER